MSSEWTVAAAKAIPEEPDTCVQYTIVVVVPSRNVPDMNEEALHMMREYGSAEIEETLIITEKNKRWFS